MIKNYKAIIGTKIIEYDSGNVIALLKDIIVNPDNGMLEGFWVKPLTIPISDAIIQSQDIIEWKKNIYIKDESVISDPADIISISDILLREAYVIGNFVQNQEGEFLGRVYTLDFDSNSFYIRGIYSEKSLLGIYSYNKRIFPYDSVIEILPSAIIVKDKVSKEEVIRKGKLIEDPSLG